MKLATGMQLRKTEIKNSAEANFGNMFVQFQVKGVSLSYAV